MNSLINISVSSLNVRGINDPVKRRLLFNSFEKSKTTIFLLQETKLDPSQHLEVSNEWKNGPIFLNSVFGKKSGTIVLFNTFQVKILSEVFDNEGRVIALDFEILGNKFHLVNFYIPNDNAPKRQFIQNSYKFIMSNFPIIFGGDFNLTVDNTVDRFPPRRVADTHSGLFKNVVQTFNLVDVCRSVYPDKLLFTFKISQNDSCVMSRIDRLLVSKHFRILKYEQNVCEYSDHECITAHFQFESQMVLGKSFWRNNTKLFATEGFEDKFKNFWEQLKNKKRALYNGNLSKWWLEMKYDLRRMLTSLGKSNSVFENREINMMKHTLDTLLQVMTNHPNNKSCVKQYFDYKKKLSSKQLNLAKQKILKDNAEKCFFGDRPTKEFFEIFMRKSDPKAKIIFEMKDSNGTTYRNTHDILEIGRKYYQDLFSEKQLSPNPGLEEQFLNCVKQIPPEFLDMLKSPISMQELRDTIFSFKKGKSPGPDGLSIEFYCSVFSIIKKDLLQVLNNFFSTGFIPAKYKVGIITLIPKREPLDEISSYRPINLLNVDLKIYSKILCTRMKPILSYVLHESQFCQPGKNIGQLVTTIRDLHFDMNESDKDSFLIDFLILRKVYFNRKHKNTTEIV